MSIHKLTLILQLFCLGVVLQTANAQKYQSATVAFYNVENIFDTIESAGYIDGTKEFNDPDYHISIPVSEIDKYEVEEYKLPYTYENLKGKKIIRPLILQDEFLPKGKKVWTSKRYQIKINNIARVISELGVDVTKTPPVIVGLCEIENAQNIIDIANTSHLKKYNYGVVHFNSFDARGVDVGLMYQKDRFVPTFARPYPVYIFDENGARRYTRDILAVTGLLDGEEITFIVNHWPSRSAGEKVTMPGRIESAKVMRDIMNELKAKNPNAKIIAMGDFNDDPVSPSIRDSFKPAGEKKKVKADGYYNPMIPYFKKGIGTLTYRDAWNLFDQFIMTGSLVTNSNDFDTYKVFRTEIYNKAYLISQSGQYKGSPHRTYSGDTFRADGYSDHLPIYTILIRSAN